MPRTQCLISLTLLGWGVPCFLYRVMPSFQQWRIFVISLACPSWSLTSTIMAAAARFFIRGANYRLPVSSVGTGTSGSVGAALLKLSPSCSSRSKTQRRHAAHFTYQPDPVPTQYGERLYQPASIGWSDLEQQQRV